MNRRGWRTATIVVASAVVMVAVWRLLAATAGLEVTSTTVDGLPVTVMARADVSEPAPGIVVAHGFAGSRQLMRTFGVSFARHGYVVALPDLAGHGANPAPLDREGDVLRDDVLAVADLLVRDHGVRDGEVVLLGHSMGSGAVMRAGIEQPDAAVGVIAVSPTDAEVTDTLPRDLKLLAGALEGRFVANAQDLLARAGGPAGAPGTDGTARHIEIVPGVEHVTILFSPRAHAAAADWADRVVGRDVAGFRSVGLIGWWLAALLGMTVVWRALVPLVAPRLAGLPDPLRAADPDSSRRPSGSLWRSTAYSCRGSPQPGQIEGPAEVEAASKAVRRGQAFGVRTWVGAVVGVGATAVVVPGLGFVLLLLPLLPPLVGLLVAVLAPWVRATGQVWAAAVAAASFLGWITAVLFPLV